MYVLPRADRLAIVALWWPLTGCASVTPVPSRRRRFVIISGAQSADESGHIRVSLFHRQRIGASTTSVILNRS